MRPINWLRILGCGALAGSAAFAIGVVILIFRLWQNFESATSFLGRPFALPGPAVAFAILGLYLALGIVTIWLYAALRPSYGVGPKTAALSAAAIWIVVALAEVNLAALGVFPVRPLIIPMVVFLLGIVAGAELGAAHYKET
jgi:hypothetical protein